ncbi:leucyl/phenylalanyl-tRNA--protein transferase [Rhabdothermincola salaria]|uniref:leucyl/phenylalanyl-tRNA--protein transferase n=1 Tax=Rhabdothermincola salaria TaxID=2903142 RepID=UPI001E3B75C0|nr:leucyl/phenylalanyl-tRNA--protein transferase [Rhabdothermincola salaria]
MPVEPPRTPWEFPDLADVPGGDDLVAVGADLEPGTLVAAYRHGLFPMPLSGHRAMAWWSPDPRGVLPLDGLRVTRSLRRSQRRYEVRVDTAFDDVVEACADPARDGGWISDEIRRAYARLHELGWAHSVETWDPATGTLVGGLYGVHVDGLFAGESMFHRAPDASKVALVALVEHLRSIGVVLLDVQWLTDHLTSLGAVEIPRVDYLARLRQALDTTTAPFA